MVRNSQGFKQPPARVCRPQKARDCAIGLVRITSNPVVAPIASKSPCCSKSECCRSLSQKCYLWPALTSYSCYCCPVTAAIHLYNYSQLATTTTTTTTATRTEIVRARHKQPFLSPSLSVIPLSIHPSEPSISSLSLKSRKRERERERQQLDNGNK